MSMEVIQAKKASSPVPAMILLFVLAAALLGMAVVFAYLLLSGKGNNYQMGTLLAFEFLVGGIEVVVYARYFLVFREVSEDREEELLW
ncbi:MAG: hypothetical protein P8130_09585 [Deltaproteobacteria bacterium]